MLSFYSSIDRRKSIEPMADNSVVGKENKNEMKMNRKQNRRRKGKEINLGATSIQLLNSIKIKYISNES